MPSSETVWNEQVAKGLEEFLNSFLFKKDGITPIPVFVRKPDEDFKKEEYPCVTLYNVSSTLDKIRYNHEDIVVGRDAVNHTLILEKNAVPYNLLYQIDFWSKSNTDMDRMNIAWLSKTGSLDFNLPVKDMSGNDRSCYVLLRGDIKKLDSIEGKERIFRSFMTYRVHIEIDEKVQTTAPMVTEVSLS